MSAFAVSVVSLPAGHADPDDRPRTYLEAKEDRLARSIDASVPDARTLLEQTLIGTVLTPGELVILSGMVQSNPAKELVVEADATASGGWDDHERSGMASVALQARAVGDYCDVYAASVSARLSDTAASASKGDLRASAGVCFLNGLYSPPTGDDPSSTAAFPLRVTGQLALSSDTTFAAWRSQPQSAFTSLGYRFYWALGSSMPVSPDRGITYFPIAFDQTWEWRDTFKGRRAFKIDGTFSLYERFRRREPWALSDRTSEVLVFRLYGARTDVNIALVDFYPVKFHGIGLRNDQLLLDLDVGVGGSNATIMSSDCIDTHCVDETITTDDSVAKISTLVANTGLSTGTRDRSAGVKFVRRLDINVLKQISIENRASAWFESTMGVVSGHAEVFGGRATHYLSSTTSGAEGFVGASVDITHDFAPFFAAGVELDGIKTFDRNANLEGRVAGSGVRGFVTAWFRQPLARRRLPLPALPPVTTAAPPPPAPVVVPEAPSGEPSPPTDGAVDVEPATVDPPEP